MLSSSKWHTHGRAECRDIRSAMLSSRLSLALLIACQAPPQVEPMLSDDTTTDLALDRAAVLAAEPSECSLAVTVPGPRWQPTTLLQIPVVVHIIADAGCATGAVSDQTVIDQIAALNEDFRAVPG